MRMGTVISQLTYPPSLATILDFSKYIFSAKLQQISLKLV